MTLGTLDLSMWPPALVFALVVIVLVCHVLPDVISLSPSKRSSRPSSPSGQQPTASRASTKTQASN